jgi:hypothetical protein
MLGQRSAKQRTVEPNTKSALKPFESRLRVLKQQLVVDGLPFWTTRDRRRKQGSHLAPPRLPCNIVWVAVRSCLSLINHPSVASPPVLESEP